MTTESYLDGEGRPITLERLVKKEPEWAVSIIRMYKNDLEQLAKTVHNAESMEDELFHIPLILEKYRTK